MLVEVKYDASSTRQGLSNHFHARGLDHAREIIQLRGNWERDPRPPLNYYRDAGFPKLPTTHIAESKFAAANHSLIWLSMIASRMPNYNAWEFLQDNGLIHEMAHELHEMEASGPNYYKRPNCNCGVCKAGNTRNYVNEKYLTRLREFELMIPGADRSWAIGEAVAAPPPPLLPEYSMYDAKYLEAQVLKPSGREQFRQMQAEAEKLKLRGQRIGRY